MNKLQITKDFNIVISTWASAGGTTLSLILANLYGLKYIYAGGVLKHWCAKMGYDPKSDEIRTWETKYGDSWDRIWEDYIQLKLKNEKNFLCEGKTAGFLLEQGAAFEVMLTAELAERTKRASGDGRIEQIAARDDLLRKRWLRLFDIDFMDLESIFENYDLVVNSTNLSIGQTVHAVVEEIDEHFKLDSMSEQISMTIDEIEQQYWTDEALGVSGKERLKENLASEGLLISPEDVFADWKSDRYKSLADKLPKEMSTVL